MKIKCFYNFYQVDKLEQSEAVRSEEEQKAEERPLVIGNHFYFL